MFIITTMIGENQNLLLYINNLAQLSYENYPNPPFFEVEGVQVWVILENFIF